MPKFLDEINFVSNAKQYTIKPMWSYDIMIRAGGTNFSGQQIDIWMCVNLILPLDIPFGNWNSSNENLAIFKKLWNNFKNYYPSNIPSWDTTTSAILFPKSVTVYVRGSSNDWEIDNTVTGGKLNILNNNTEWKYYINFYPEFGVNMNSPSMKWSLLIEPSSSTHQFDVINKVSLFPKNT